MQNYFVQVSNGTKFKHSPILFLQCKRILARVSGCHRWSLCASLSNVVVHFL